MPHDYIIVGAGIVGAATCLELICRRPQARILLIDKESTPARHQTGHNSGVVHAGVYYEPGSLKARFCREGVFAMKEFCNEHGLPFETTGKLIVATSEQERARLDALLGRCRENGLEPRLVGRGELHELEPRIEGLAAIHVADTAITDYRAVCEAMVMELRQRGGQLCLGSAVTAIRETDDSVSISTTNGEYRAARLVVCGGLQADRLARMQGIPVTFRTVPYRGEYFRLRPGLNGIVQHLVYPVPDPALPFLGVHLTRMVDGSVTVGPNAVQGWSREGYGKFDFRLRDTADMLAFPGWWKLTAKHLRQGLKETWNSAWKRAYLGQVRKYCPRIGLDDLLPHPAGIRAQAVARDGTMIHDFLLERTPRSLHVCNAPSPAATSSVPIARHVCDLLLES